VFSTDDYNAAIKPPVGVTECMYNGFRLPPSDPNKYEVNLDYWHVLAARLAFVVIFEVRPAKIEGILKIKFWFLAHCDGNIWGNCLRYSWLAVGCARAGIFGGENDAEGGSQTKTSQDSFVESVDRSSYFKK